MTAAEGDTPHGPRTLGRVVCSDGWAAARFLLAQALEDASTPSARALALALRAEAGPGDGAFVAHLFDWVKHRIRFVREHGEVFARVDYTIAAGAGDCDDHARVVAALLLAGGVPARLAFLSRPRDPGPRHVTAQAYLDGRWVWLETTVDAALGEHPYAAARRLGLVNERSDIATEERTMSERDLPPLPPLPAGFTERAEPFFDRDVEALRRIGAIPVDLPVTGPADVPWRRYVAAYQEERGLVPDGLVGPVTRRQILAELQAFGPPIDQGLGYPGLGSLTPLTSHLSSEFFRRVIAMAERFRRDGATATAEDFLAVWLAESDIRPDLQNRGGAPFYGLNQLGIPMHSKTVGWEGSGRDYLALDAADQVPYVERYYRAMGHPSTLRDAGSLYLANFLPKFMGHAGDPSFVLADRDDDTFGWYRDNAGLDVDGDGKIRVSDLSAAIERVKRARAPYWAEVLRRLDEEKGAAGRGGSAGALLAIGLTIAAAWWMGGQS